jgi:hypothetical protein
MKTRAIITATKHDNHRDAANIAQKSPQLNCSQGQTIF